MHIHLNRLALLMAGTLVIGILYGVGWTTIAHIQLCWTVMTAVLIILSYMVAFVEPTVWVRHKTTKQQLNKILRDGFKGHYDERVRTNVISTSNYFDNAWSRLTDARYTDEETVYIYIKAPVKRADWRSAYLKFNGQVFRHGRGMSITVTEADANKAIRVGNISMTKPKSWLSIEGVAVWLSGFTASVTLEESTR